MRYLLGFLFVPDLLVVSFPVFNVLICMLSGERAWVDCLRDFLRVETDDCVLKLCRWAHPRKGKIQGPLGRVGPDIHGIVGLLNVSESRKKMKGTTSRECFGRLLFSFMLLYSANSCFTFFNLTFAHISMSGWFPRFYVSPVVKRFVGCYAFWLSWRSDDFSLKYSYVSLASGLGVLNFYLF